MITARTTITGTALGLLVALTVVPAAGATIVPNQSVAGVRIKASEATVRAKLGRPSNVVSGSQRILSYRSRGFFVIITKGKVREVLTIGRKERTAKGIGEGSSTGELKEAYPQVRCRPAPLDGRTLCLLGSSARGKGYTSFSIDDESDRVTNVSVGHTRIGV